MVRLFEAEWPCLRSPEWSTPSIPGSIHIRLLKDTHLKVHRKRKNNFQVMTSKESSRCCFLDLAVVSLPQWKAAWASSPWCAPTPCSPDQLFDLHDNHADHTTKRYRWWWWWSLKIWLWYKRMMMMLIMMRMKMRMLHTPPRDRIKPPATNPAPRVPPCTDLLCNILC